MTADQLLREPPDGRCELVRGELIMMTPAGASHGRIALNVGFLLASHVRSHHLGVVYAAETGFCIERNPDTVRAPDVAFVRRECATGDESGFFDGPPDLAVEVVSPTDKGADVQAKAQQWLDAGASEVWVGWQQTRSVTISRADQPQRILHEQDKLEGGHVVPGFICQVRDIFA